MKERAFFLLKPDGMSLERQIMAILEPHARVVAERLFPRAPMKRIAALYQEHKGKEFYPWLLKIFREQPTKAFILEPRKRGKKGDFHKLLEKIVGATDPRKAARRTIRALSDDDMKVSMSRKRAVRNLVHRGLTPQESLCEGALFFHDVLGPGEGAITVGPFALEFVNPLAVDVGGDRVTGIFFGERLQDLLRRMTLIPPGATVTSYREAEERENLVLHVTCLAKGQSHNLAITLTNDQ